MNTETSNHEHVIMAERTNADEFLRFTSELYGALFIAYDFRNQKLLYPAEPLYQMLGYAPADLDGNYFQFDELLHPDDVAGFHQTVQLLGEKKEIPPGSVRLRHKDGAYAVYKIRARGKTNGPFAMLLLISEHSAYAEMDEINELKKAKANMIRDLQRSNKELEEFAYVASHDLQEPLRKISTFSGRLSHKYEDLLNEEGQLYLRRIVASTENMRTLIDNLLDFSRISRTQQPFTELNLNFVVQQIKNELELSIEETGTQIKTDNLPVVEASLTQMKQLFSNIVNNAIKFRKPDIPPQIKIVTHELSAKEKKAHQLSPENVYHSLKFYDNGIGFEKEYAMRIFQIFQRLHGKSEYPGSGIGLAICKKIVDHHHGIIYAENIAGSGACFTVILPAQQS